MIQNLSRVYPIHSTNNIISFDSLHSIKSEFIKEFILMLPVLNEDNGQDFMNKYCCVGHIWTERTNEGKFTPAQINKIYSWTGMKMKTVRIMTHTINNCLINYITLMNFLILI